MAEDMPDFVDPWERLAWAFGMDPPQFASWQEAVEALENITKTPREQPHFWCRYCYSWQQSGHHCPPQTPVLPPGVPDPLPQTEWREPIPSWLPTNGKKKL